jgi:hypothetical protein
MLCLSTITLALVLGSLFVAQLISRDGKRAQLTFFMGLLALFLQHLGCRFGGDAGGWLSLGLLVAVIVLIFLVHAGVFLPSPSVTPNECKPSSSSCTGCPASCPNTAPCPGIDPCPAPTCI